jgi:cysteine-S-conjugate beta-lyase
MQYDFDKIPNRRGTDCIKWEHHAQDVLPMWVADMDFVSPAPVVQALRRRVDAGLFGYPTGLHGEANELTGLRKAIVDWVGERYEWKIQPIDQVFVPGVVIGFNKAALAVGNPGDGIVIQPPVYPPMLDAPSNTKMMRQDAPLARMPDGSYEIDWDLFRAAFTPETRLFLLCNPHNPTGRVFRRDELERMAEICLERGVTICSDEIHGDMVYRDHRHIPIASLSPEIAQNTITLIAPSKTFNLAGLSCAIAVIPNPKLRGAYADAGKGLAGWVNMLGLAAAEAAYRDGSEWLEQLMAYLKANRDFVYDYVRSEMNDITMVRPEGTYLAWLDCRNAGINGNPAKFFLDNAKVAFNDGDTFGPGGAGFVRLNYGTPRALVKEGLERMSKALRAAKS